MKQAKVRLGALALSSLRLNKLLLLLTGLALRLLRAGLLRRLLYRLLGCLLRRRLLPGRVLWRLRGLLRGLGCLLHRGLLWLSGRLLYRCLGGRLGVGLPGSVVG